MHYFTEPLTKFKEVVVTVSLPHYLLRYINQANLITTFQNVTYGKLKHAMRDKLIWELGNADISLTAEIRRMLDSDKTYTVLSYVPCATHEFKIGNKLSNKTYTQRAVSLAKAKNNVTFGMCSGRPRSCEHYHNNLRKLELLWTDHPDHNRIDLQDLPQQEYQAELEIRIVNYY